MVLICDHDEETSYEPKKQRVKLNLCPAQFNVSIGVNPTGAT